MIEQSLIVAVFFALSIVLFVICMISIAFTCLGFLAVFVNSFLTVFVPFGGNRALEQDLGRRHRGANSFSGGHR